ncbi:hypothetical protein GYH30_051660 [Glycine max]|uniref:Uncharacterized protein n=1 Tax=Glycine soja TaxID=3848 RepID=A0A445FAR6_GLYSO|nr:hypothetical protein GYH30_051660 [Glycine max]RZB45911.1 hypothetical protein D0Y65_050100 [Glycine soja]
MADEIWWRFSRFIFMSFSTHVVEFPPWKESLTRSCLQKLKSTIYLHLKQGLV